MGNTPTSGENVTQLSQADEQWLAEVEEKYEAERGQEIPQSILTRGALLRCSCGTHCRRLNLPQSYGVYIDGDKKHPKVHANNCMVGDDKNISYYGVCKSKNGPETKENINLEPYVWPDGTKTSESKVSGNRCMPKIMKMWFDTVSDEQILDLDDAETYEGLSMKSFLVCKYGGIITAYESGQEFDDAE